MAKKVEKGTAKDPGVKKKGKASDDGIKRPMSAFFWFLHERRPKLIEEKPELKSKVKEVGRLLGDEWKAMTDAQKAPFVKKNEEDKLRYNNEKAKKQKSE